MPEAYKTSILLFPLELTPKIFRNPSSYKLNQRLYHYGAKSATSILWLDVKAVVAEKYLSQLIKGTLNSGSSQIVPTCHFQISNKEEVRPFYGMASELGGD